MSLRSFVLSFFAIACAGALHAQQQPAKLELRQGDHVAIIGNALADRMQHTGWLETLIQARNPQQQLVFRNLAVAADEVDTWHRSQEFGSRDEWLTWTQADVIFAFYGFNESFDGYEGVEKFKANLEKFIKNTQKQNYSGNGAPRIVLFSPIANEKHQDPNFPDPQANNTNLKNYADAMAEVAKANGIQFVDLFTPSQKAFAEAASKGQSLTINGMHLTEEGDKVLAPSRLSGSLRRIRTGRAEPREASRRGETKRTGSGTSVTGRSTDTMFSAVARGKSTHRRALMGKSSPSRSTTTPSCSAKCRCAM
jgi:lysophospholipase L1-like esterase